MAPDISRLAHELIHALLDDNERALKRYWRMTGSSLEGEDRNTIAHIPVHALMIQTLGNVFG